MLYDKRPSLLIVLLVDALIGLLGYGAMYVWAALDGLGDVYNRPVAMAAGCTCALMALTIHVALWIGINVTVIGSPAVSPETPVPAGNALDQDTNTNYRAGIAYLPMAGGFTATIHVTETQFKLLRDRVIHGNLSLPVNGIDGLTSSQMRKLREELLRDRLARLVNGNQMEWTPEAAAAVLHGSPTPLVQRGYTP